MDCRAEKEGEGEEREGKKGGQERADTAGKARRVIRRCNGKTNINININIKTNVNEIDLHEILAGRKVAAKEGRSTSPSLSF
jgi:hypothetical protein